MSQDPNTLALYDAVQNLITSLEIPHITITQHGNSANTLAGLFRILLFKRLESSIHSFIISLNRLIDKEKKFKVNVKKHGWKQTIARNNDEIISVKDDQELTDYIETMDQDTDDNGNADLSDQDVIDLVDSDLKHIYDFKSRYLDPIISKNKEYEDPKLDQLKKILSSMTRQKILIFTQYADTAEYLNERLQEFAKKNNKILDCIIGDITRDVGNHEIDTEEKIRRFAPKANRALLEDGEEIDILVSTDTLSEGVNLQDSSVIINYDLPWNPMRIVQRVGRVDRIGSSSRTTVFNIIPNKELEAFLSLLEKLESKIKNITDIVGKESYILSENEDLDPKTIGKKLKEVRTSEDYRTYENRVNAQLDLQTDDAHGQKIILLRQKMIEHNMSCSDKRGMVQKQYSKEDSPYSIIQENMEQCTFVLFRVYDKSKNKKIHNLMILKDMISNEYKIIHVDDSKILSLPEMSRGISKMSAKPFELNDHVEDIIKYFEDEKFSEINKKYNKINMIVEGVNATANAQKYVSDHLDHIISSKQKQLDGEISGEILSNTEYCISKLRDHVLHKKDASKLNHWYGSSDIRADVNKLTYPEFVEKTTEYIKNYIIESRGYTTPRRKDDIAYSIVCRGASI